MNGIGQIARNLADLCYTKAMLQDEPQSNPPQGQEVPIPAEPTPVEPAPAEPAAPVEVPVEQPPIETPPSELPSKESVEQLPSTRSREQQETKGQTYDLNELRAMSHLSRKQKRERAFSKIEERAAQKGTIKNQDVRDLLRVSQSTVTDYLDTLVKQGKLKKTGRGRATSYSK